MLAQEAPPAPRRGPQARLRAAGGRRQLQRRHGGRPSAPTMRAAPSSGCGPASCGGGRAADLDRSLRPSPASRLIPCPLLGSRSRARSARLHAARRAAQHARSRAARRALGLPRYWVAEHHNMVGHRQRRDRRSSSATSPAAPSTIRVGAGGIMLPNHAPLVIAEQFGTLESLYPGPHRSRPRPRARHRPAARCGRCAATRRSADTFPQDVLELQALLGPAAAGPGGPGGARRRHSTCRSGSSARACSARSSPRCWACPTPSPRTSRRMR